MQNKSIVITFLILGITSIQAKWPIILQEAINQEIFESGDVNEDTITFFAEYLAAQVNAMNFGSPESPQIESCDSIEDFYAKYTVKSVFNPPKIDMMDSKESNQSKMSFLYSIPFAYSPQEASLKSEEMDQNIWEQNAVKSFIRVTI